MADKNSTKRSGLNELSTNLDSREIESYYNTWAKDYDQNLADWHYQAPNIAADLLKRDVSVESKVLDAGCGTGLTGMALQRVGYQYIIGMDISQEALVQAQQTSAYNELKKVNMQTLPLPYETNEFAGLLCVGVLTYIPDTDGILREFCRIVQSGGLVVFTQRDDLFAERHCTAIFKALEHAGLWKKISVSDPHPYLPDNVDFGDRIKVIYCVFRVV